ncbi:MAG: tRNA preQ1(34) S-adenosylmethionine ribosyltransferase-isomerase QueA [Gammaproteobacteria bacterium]|nr:tRNA preQ1(34) S-adenosylmethionine ribosyltransferase-isomerase QueA [Gammaproteobacteria bacterium]
MLRSEFDYNLPVSLIAQFPLPERTASRLLDIRTENTKHRVFADLPSLLEEGDLLVVNDTKVIKARLRGKKDSGGTAEILVERLINDQEALCQVRVSKPLKMNRLIHIGGQELEVLGREGEFYRLGFPGGVQAILAEYGEVPLPPYVRRPVQAEDGERYQTVYGTVPGAVAAPTAGLHFSDELIARLKAGGVEMAAVTLHVGAGTFQPVRTERLEEHHMHREYYQVSQATVDAIVSCRKRNRRVVAVGTTVVRALESATDENGLLSPGEGDTDLFIVPGYHFKTVKVLLTNFHLPASTLLMLVCAFGGFERVMKAYREAIADHYRFFSYGDAMLLECQAVLAGEGASCSKS